MVREGSRRFEGYRNFSNLIFTVVTRCVGYLYTVSEWFNPLEPPRTFSNHFSAEVPYTPCSHCVDEVREGSVQSNHSELTSKTSTHLAFSALKWFEKVRGGSRGLNHSEIVYRYPTHLAFSALKWFEKVGGGSRGLNHSETVYRYPTHLVTTVKMRFEKVRYSRTTPNSRQRLLHTLLSLH